MDGEEVQESWAASIREARAARDAASTDLAQYVLWKEKMRLQCEAMDKAQAARAWKPAAVRLEVLIASRQIACRVGEWHRAERPVIEPEREGR